ncbi:MAG: alanine racemase, partial [Myxococcota bacterium]
RFEHVHACNTSAAWRFPEMRYNMVRVGLGLYGLSPSEAVASQAKGVHPALTFSTRVTNLQLLPAGESVGYARAWFARRDARIATIAAGYHDGFPRFMSQGGEVLVGGVRCPVVGNVCMDAAMVDVTAVGDVRIGDDVVLFGTQGSETITVDEIAQRGGTISYEILASISPRVRRIFTHES